MQLDELLKKLPENFTALDVDRIKKAYQFAEKAHQGQTLASGLPYISHCVAVAAILCELTVPPDLIITGLLHDVVEDTSFTLEDIQKEFSPEIASLVDGVTKLNHLPNLLRGDQHSEAVENKIEAAPKKKIREEDIAEALRMTFLAMSDDIRVVLVKLADRLHNMRTLSYCSEEMQKRIAQETLEIFAPLANRLGIWQIKWELEDLAFRYVAPKEYKDSAEKLDNRRADRERQIQDIIDRLKSE
ncbi:MAG TPA: (p)ppGpp synthetase, partial [Anaerolineaceae bacterium]|nr:(p)ppGpp synthetase [Anaerolineaceae bacterium]